MGIGPVITLLAIVGAVGIILGLRRKSHGDHPICAKCGYDQTGKPPESNRCAECGSDLREHGAVRIGKPRFNRRLIIAGAIALLLIEPVIAINSNWYRYAPVWWLRMDLKGGDQTQIDALNELQRRLAAGTLSENQIDEVADRCLAVQGNAAIPWRAAWGNFVEKAHAMGRVNKARWITYLEHESQIVLSSRAVIAQGDLIPVHIDLAGPRGTQHVAAYMDAHDVTLDGKPIMLRKIPGASSMEFDWVRDDEYAGLQPCADRTTSTSVSPGRHEIRLLINVRIYKFPGFFSYPEPSAGSRLVQFDVPASMTVNIASRANALPTTFVDASLRETVRRAVRVSELTETGNLHYYPHGGLFDVKGKVTVEENTPARLEFQFFARLPGPTGTEVHLGDALGESLGGTPQFELQNLLYTSFGPKDLLAGVKSVDIICRPDMDYIETSLVTTPAWGEVVVIPNVKVIHK